MARTPMSEEARAAASARMKAVWAERRNPTSRADRAIEHVAGGVLRSELDEIEGAIDRRESSLSRLKTDEEVAGMRVVTANAELRRVNDLTAKAKEKLDLQLRTNAAVEKQLASRTAFGKREVDELEEVVGRLKDTASNVKAEISERIIYRDRQEKEIAEVTEKGNDRLYEVDQEVKELLRKRDGVQQIVSDLEDKQRRLESDCDLTSEKIDQLELRYMQTAKRYRAELLDIRVSITKAETDLVELNTKAERIHSDLVAKGKSALAREEAIAAREAELVSRERLLKSRESRYS